MQTSIFILFVSVGVLFEVAFSLRVSLNISQYSQENICARVSFLIKLKAWGLQLYKKGDSGSCCPMNFVKFVRTSFFVEHRFLKTLKSRKILICFVLIICSYLLMKYIMYMALNNTFFFLQLFQRLFTALILFIFTPS